jgi:hypothetical protein
VGLDFGTDIQVHVVMSKAWHIRIHSVKNYNTNGFGINCVPLTKKSSVIRITSPTKSICTETFIWKRVHPLDSKLWPQGCLSKIATRNIVGLGSFPGHCYFTGQRPHADVEFTRHYVVVIRTGGADVCPSTNTEF